MDRSTDVVDEGRHLAIAARDALANLDDEARLLNSPLLPSEHALTYRAVRAIVLDALDSLDDISVGVRALRRHRGREILARCDIAGREHGEVIEELALSRRQFYRDRREALIQVAQIIKQKVAHDNDERVGSARSSGFFDLVDAGEAYVEALRSAGQYSLVWQEAVELANQASGSRREADYWLVASEAARFFADAWRARKALEAARICNVDRPWHSTWFSEAEMSLDWLDGQTAGTFNAFEAAALRGDSNRAMYGKEAVLLAYALCAAVRIELDRGGWENARTMLSRAAHLAENGSASKARSLTRLISHIHRLSGLLAFYSDGDRDRAIVRLSAAVENARASDHLGAIAESSVYFGVVMGAAGSDDALKHADFGLSIAQRIYAGDRLAELTLEVIPLFLSERGPEAASFAVSQARSPDLGVRDTLFLELAELKIAVHSGRHAEAIERGKAAAGGLMNCGILSRAYEAKKLLADAYARLNRRTESAAAAAEGDALLKSARCRTFTRGTLVTPKA